MDENTLNDLLECSVCLERLDTSSKVLPCQHTFCRKCLEVIFASHRELRCPECRVLVNVRIDELPPNVLLMRILGGLKSTKSTTQAKCENTAQEMDIGQEEHNYSRPNETHGGNGLHQLNTGTAENSTAVSYGSRITSTNNSQARSTVNVPHAFALYDFTSNERWDLSFKKGDLILMKRQIDANWYMGLANGKEGTFPINYVQVVIPLPSSIPQCMALFDFKMGPNEEEGCLRFQKGAAIHVIRRIDQNWAEGRIGSNIGIFPIEFVALNTAAKQLLDGLPTRGINTQPPQTSQTRNLPPIPLLDPTINNHANDSTSSSSSLATGSPNSVNTSTSSTHSTPGTPNQSLPNTPQHNASNSVRFRYNVHKRHSLNALLGSGNAVTPTLSVLQTNRHSAEILSIPDDNVNAEASSSAAQAYKASDIRTDVRNIFGLNGPPVVGAVVEQQALMPSNSNGRANVMQSMLGRPNLPWSYVALYPYKPHKPDELELKKGCVYIVTERCRDGWFKGKNWQDVSGVFPGNYVTPLRTRDQQQLMHQPQCVPLPTANAASATASNNQANLATATATTQRDFAQSHAGANASSAPLKPPELPPRCAEQTTQVQEGASTASSHVWSKPLSLVHKIDNLFVDGNCAAGNKKQKITQQSSVTSKEPNNKDIASATTSSSVAANLMKRLSSMKSRSKSPHLPKHDSDSIQQPAGNNEQTLQRSELQHLAEKDNAPTKHIHPVHVRSGSCPSKFAQSAPIDASLPNPTQQRQPQKCATQVTYGSQRVKGSKERTSCLYTPPTNMIPTVQQHQPQPQSKPQPQLQQISQPQPQQISQPQATTLLNLLFNKYSHQEHNYAATQHRKSQSLDAGNILTAPTMQSPNDVSKSHNLTANPFTRVRCVVPYPPNSDIELELQVGDVIYVERKLTNGWYKGTSVRNAKTGLFPATFVEPE